MANRKVLINRHTSTSGAPIASEMFKGEIAVAHETGKEILWTKNNDDIMVPFISCAQTISIIDSKVQASEDVVKAKDNEVHLEVESGGTTGATEWILSTKDIQSEEEFKAYSAETKTRIDKNVSAITDTLGIISALTNVVVTDISGDTIIVAEKVDATTGSNSYNLTHKQAPAAIATGFNKLATDVYGHVTASTAVAATDIKTLGFEDSAWTEAKITEAIEGLDSDSATTDNRHYVTAITIEDGKITSFGEAADPQLSVESAGTGNVVSQITVADHKISYTTTSVATSEDIQKLSAATESFSAGTYSEFTSAFTAINNLSANTEAADGKVFTSAKTYADELIAALDSATAVTAGKYMTGIAIANGKISGITEADLPELSKVVSGAGNVFTDIEVNDHEIVINKGLTVASDADLKALSGVVENFSAATNTKFTELSAATSAVSVDVENLSAVTITGVSLNNTPLTVTDHIVSVPVTVSGDGIANATNSGSVADAKAVKEYVQDILSSSVDYKGATNTIPSDPVKGDLWIASSAFTVDGKNVEVGDFIIYNGTSWDVIEKNLDGAITGNLTENTVTLGDSTNSVKSLPNGTSGQVLTMAGGAPAWVDDPELTVVSAGTGNVLTDITVDDHEITFTKGITAASDADLRALSGVVEEFSATTNTKFTELSAYTKDVDDKVKALSAGTIQLSADTEAAINQLSGFAHNSMIARDDAVFSSAKTYTDEKVAAEIALLDSVGSASTTGHYLTSVTITDGKISAVGEQQLPAATPVTTVNGTTGDTAAAVIASVVTGGTEGHQLTLNMTNKVYSAATADEAVKVKSALTINVLDSAGTTASTVTFDGSSNRTIEIPGSHDTATTETGHYAPSTTASSLDAAAGTVLNKVTLDSKNHVISAGTTDKINSASTAESADTASKVNNALSVSGYASSDSSALDTAFAYDGSAAKSLTFGTNGPAGLKSMSMTSAGLVDVEVIDCGEY